MKKATGLFRNKKQHSRRESCNRILFFGTWILFLSLGCSQNTLEVEQAEQAALLAEKETSFLRGFHQVLPTRLSRRQTQNAMQVLRDEKAEAWLKKRAWASLPAADWRELSDENREILANEIQALFKRDCAEDSVLKRICRRARLQIYQKKAQYSLNDEKEYCDCLKKELQTSDDAWVQEDAFRHALQSKTPCAKGLVEDGVLKGPQHWQKLYFKALKRVP